MFFMKQSHFIEKDDENPVLSVRDEDKKGSRKPVPLSGKGRRYGNPVKVYVFTDTRQFEKKSRKPRA